MLIELPYAGPRSNESLHQAIDDIRRELGDDLLIMGHHYQSDDIVRHLDRLGDSLELARMVPEIKARNIVFCGVHFMAESACLLAAPGQNVYLPDLTATCDMADMVPAPQLDAVMARLLSTGRKIVPLAYVNTSLAVKAIVGKYGGAVCTSANAKTMLAWALDQGDGVLFLPDMNLGLNIADQLNLPEAERYVLNVEDNGKQIDLEAAAQAKLLLWPGYCPIHELFLPEQIQAIRAQFPEARILVHPECPPAVVRLADASGSTSFLIREADNAPEGACLVIGTEINLVHRLSQKHQGRVQVLPLAGAICENMAKITVPALLHTLQGIVDGSAEPVEVDQSLLEPARASLTRMLENS